LIVTLPYGSSACRWATAQPIGDMRTMLTTGTESL
jgi:hypothetical protein